MSESSRVRPPNPPMERAGSTGRSSAARYPDKRKSETVTSVDVVSWTRIQAAIWACEACRDHNRVACKIRQQTDAPTCPVKLLLVGIAPPFEKSVEVKTRARSATNHAEDNLRKLFIPATLPGSWEDLLTRGLFWVHCVKCAIAVKDGHQNPPDPVVDVCASSHFAQEIGLLRPPQVVAFGKAPYRALLRVPGVKAPRGLGVSTSVANLVERTRGGVEFQADGWKFTVHVSPFPLERKRPVPLAQEVLREAARLAGVLNAKG